MPDDVQPQGGQGDGGTGVFDSYLQSVPEEARDTVASYLKDAEKQVNGRYEEAAQIRQQWEPFQGVQDVLRPYADQPDVLAERLQWLDQVTQSDDAFQQWFDSVAAERGYAKAEQEATEALEEAAPGASREDIAQMVNQIAEERIAPLQENLDRIEYEAAEEYETNSIFTELDRLAKENKMDLNESQRKAILDMALPYAYNTRGENLPLGDVSWVATGFERFKEIHNLGQKAFVDSAGKAPPAPMTTGGTAGLEATTDWAEATKMARERFAQMKST